MYYDDIHPLDSQEIEIVLDKIYKAVNSRILTSKNLRDFNSFNDPDKIKPVSFNGASLKQNTLLVKLPAFSTVVLALN